MQFNSRRSPVGGTKGIVAASQPLAVQAGLRILDQGGNAADAAVAVAAALNVTEPSSTGVGGDLFCLFFDAKTKTIRGLNGSGKSAAGVTLDVLRKAGLTTSIPADSVHSVTVPGAVAGWHDMLVHFGSGRISLKDALAPAIHIAQDGFPVGDVCAHMWGEEEAKLRRVSPNDSEFYPAPRSGDHVRLPGLASTLQIIADHGKEGFYNGPIASKIVGEVQSRGGFLSLEDLAQHKSVLTEPISMAYHGTVLSEHAPNGQGLIALIALGIVKSLEASGRVPGLDTIGHNSPEYLHIIIECLRLAFADGKRYIADPDTNPTPVKDLLSESYLAERARIFDSTRAAADVAHGIPPSSDTVYFSIVDKDGNACSVVNSIYTHFGSGIAVPGTGILLQSRGANFSLEESHPNVIAPSKRPYHTIIPAMLTDQATGNLIMSFGVMGGFMQPQGHLQTLLNTVVFGMNPQEALDAPRVCIVPEKKLVMLEEGIPLSTAEALTKLGHNVKMVTGAARASSFGRGQIIKLSGLNGVRIAGSDSRADGHAAPQF
ncbi:nucleophile aminohydrolase [Entophlyctis helioformis]|nr:nucleophile aminohydrolase [Entophlyctis helioformis]